MNKLYCCILVISIFFLSFETYAQQDNLFNNKAADSLNAINIGYPVTGARGDTLFNIYTKIGASTPVERAANISRKIKKLYEDDFLNIDSVLIQKSENSLDIVYKEIIIMSISERDALLYNDSLLNVANEFYTKIISSISEAKKENKFLKIALRTGLVGLVFVLAWLLMRLLDRAYARMLRFINKKKDAWLKNLSYNDYTFLTAEQELQTILLLIKVSRWVLYAVLLYITLPIVFSIFPFSRDWADVLFSLVWSPFKKVLLSIWEPATDQVQPGTAT